MQPHTNIMDTAQTYTYEDAYEASLKYFDGDELAAQVWVTKIGRAHV